MLQWLPFSPAPRQSKTKASQNTSVKCSQINLQCTEMTGKDTRRPDNSWLTATSTNLKTGSELASASTLGNAEVLDNVKDKAGAMVMMPARKFMSEEDRRRVRHPAYDLVRNECHLILSLFLYR